MMTAVGRHPTSRMMPVILLALCSAPTGQPHDHLSRRAVANFAEHHMMNIIQNAAHCNGAKTKLRAPAMAADSDRRNRFRARTPLAVLRSFVLQRPQARSHVIGARAGTRQMAPERIRRGLNGRVLPPEAGQAPARQAARGARRPDATGATTINKVCGSGMKVNHCGTPDLINSPVPARNRGVGGHGEQ